jgi:hypothetical protein
MMVHVSLMILAKWREFPSVPCLAGKKILDDSSGLDVVEIARFSGYASFQPLQQENTCNSAHEQTPLSDDTIDSVLRHREVGRVKDLSAPSPIPQNEMICVVLRIYSLSNYAIL